MSIYKQELLSMPVHAINDYKGAIFSPEGYKNLSLDPLTHRDVENIILGSPLLTYKEASNIESIHGNHWNVVLLFRLSSDCSDVTPYDTGMEFDCYTNIHKLHYNEIETVASISYEEFIRLVRSDPRMWTIGSESNDKFDILIRISIEIIK